MELEGIEVGDHIFGEESHAIIDSGSSMIVINPSIYYDLGLPDSQIIDCKLIDSLPIITFVFGVAHYPLTPQEYVLRISDVFEEICVLGITPSNTFESIDVILGDTFMRNYFTHWDYGKKRVGIAKAVKLY